LGPVEQKAESAIDLVSYLSCVRARIVHGSGRRGKTTGDCEARSSGGQKVTGAGKVII